MIKLSLDAAVEDDNNVSIVSFENTNANAIDSIQVGQTSEVMFKKLHECIQSGHILQKMSESAWK